MLSYTKIPSASVNPFLQISPQHHLQQSSQANLNPARYFNFEYPSRKNSDFVTAMSQIARNSNFAATGTSQNNLDLEKELSDQIKLGLALKMGLNGQQ